MGIIRRGAKVDPYSKLYFVFAFSCVLPDCHIRTHTLAMAKLDKDYKRKHKPISIQLTDPQKDALDEIVAVGKFNGRSHAIREMCMTYVKAIEEVNRTGKVYKGTWEFFKGVMAFNERLAIVNKNKHEQLDLTGMADLLDDCEVNN